jgi:putative ABC transport system permease protein
MILVAAKLAFNRIRATKTRSALTTLGIIIGTMALISLVSIAQGATRGIQSQFKGLGATNLTISATVPQSLTLEDSIAVSSQFGVEIVSNQVRTSAVVGNENNRVRASLVAVDENFSIISEPDLFVGTFLPTAKQLQDTRAVVLSSTLALDLGLNAESINTKVFIENTEYSVVGIIDDSQGFGNDGIAYVTLESAYRYFAKSPFLTNISVRVEDENLVTPVTGSLTSLLLTRHSISNPSDADFIITDASAILEALNTVQSTLTLLLGGIASISLIVGGIGIMNIMLVSVRERTREIGIRRAIGAQQSQILTQFLIEAIVLSLLGGIIGVILGEIVAVFLANLGGWEFVLSLPTIFAALGFAMLVGILFGVWPARAASKLKPVEALRFE